MFSVRVILVFLIFSLVHVTVCAQESDIGFRSIDTPSLNLTAAERDWLDMHPNLTVGVDSSWYPFEFVNEEGEFSGISADYVQYASQTLGITIRPVESRTWGEAFRQFQYGEVDVLSAIIETEDRARTITFTDPYFVAPTVIVTRKNAFYAENLESLSGRKLCLVRGFAIVELVRKDYPEVDIVLVDSIVEGLQLLNEGQVDAYLGAMSVINHEIEKLQLSNLIIAGFSPYQFEISMAVREGLEPLAGILDKAFVGMTEKEKAAIANDWLAIHVQTGTPLSTIISVGVPVLGVLIGIILVISRLNRRLQREVAQRRAAEGELRSLAHQDAVTGLSNIRHFTLRSDQALAEAADRGAPQFILFLDLNGFKGVNDRHGHKAGDDLLGLVGGRIREQVSGNDMVARIGGDEFAIHLTDSVSVADPDRIAANIVRALAQPFTTEDGVEAHIGASIGIAEFPKDGSDVESLLRAADSAMYSVKKSGRSDFQRFVPDP